MRYLSAAAMTVVVALAGPFGGSASAQTINMKFAAFEPPQAYGPAQVYGPWIEQINEDSGGSLEIELFAGSQLGKPVAQLKTVQSGVADMGLIIPSFTPGRFPGNEIGELPFLWTDPTVAGIALTRMIEKGQLRYPGVKVLGLSMTGPYQVHSSKPVTRMEDLKGLKIRAAGPIFASVTRALGATPVGMPPPSLAENISRGVVDGALLEWTILKVFRVIDVTPHHFVFPLGGVIAIVGMNEDRYAGLPQQAKAAIDKNAGVPFARLWGKVVKEQTDKIVAATTADPRHKVTVASPDQSRRWEAALRPIVDEWGKSSSTNAKLLTAFKAELAAAKDK